MSYRPRHARPPLHKKVLRTTGASIAAMAALTTVPAYATAPDMEDESINTDLLDTFTELEKATRELTEPAPVLSTTAVQEETYDYYANKDNPETFTRTVPRYESDQDTQFRVTDTIPTGITATVDGTGLVTITTDATVSAGNHQVTVVSEETATPENHNEYVFNIHVRETVEGTTVNKDLNKGSETTVQLPDNDGENTEFEVTAPLPAGITATVDMNGLVTLSADSTATTGDNTVQVVATSDTKETTHTIVLNVQSVVEDGQTFEQTLRGDIGGSWEETLPAVDGQATTFALDPSNDPAPAGVIVAVDDTTGVVTVTVGAETDYTTAHSFKVLANTASKQVVHTFNLTVREPSDTERTESGDTYNLGPVRGDKPVNAAVTVTGVDGKDTTFELGNTNSLPGNLTASVDASTGEITVTGQAPTDAGTYSFTVLAKTNTTWLKHTINLEVRPAYADELYEFSYGDTIDAQRGETTTTPQPQWTNVDDDTDATKPAGTTYAVADAPWAAINPNTGELTLTPGDHVDVGARQTLTITATAPNGTVTTTTVAVVVKEKDSRAYTPRFSDNTHVTQTKNHTYTPVVDEHHFDNGTDTVGGRFEPGDIDSMTATINHNNVDVATDKNTGAVTLITHPNTIPGNAEITVTYTYADGSTDTLTHPVVIDPITGADRYEPRWDDIQVNQNRTTTSTVTVEDVLGTHQLPQGSNVKVTTITKDGNNVGLGGNWYSLNNQGELTVAPGWNITPGTYQFTITTTYPNGTQDIDTTTVKVGAGKLNERYTPTLTPRYVSSALDSAITDNITNTGAESLPAGTRFAVTTADIRSLVTVDPHTGEVTFAVPGQNVALGTDKATITLTYPDGTQDTIQAVYVVGANLQSDNYEPVTTPVELKRRTTAVIAAPVNSDKDVPLPTGSTLSEGRAWPNWATITAGGEITLNPSLDVRPGKYTFYSIVTYPDTTTDVVENNVTIISGYTAEGVTFKKRPDGLGARVGRALDKMLGTEIPGKHPAQAAPATPLPTDTVPAPAATPLPTDTVPSPQPAGTTDGSATTPSPTVQGRDAASLQTTGTNALPILGTGIASGAFALAAAAAFATSRRKR